MKAADSLAQALPFFGVSADTSMRDTQILRVLKDSTIRDGSGKLGFQSDASPELAEARSHSYCSPQTPVWL